MTLESYEKASSIVTKLRSLDAAIYELKTIIQRNDTSNWILEVRASKSHSLQSINHYGTLPKILDTILTKHLAERDALVDELAKL